MHVVFREKLRLEETETPIDLAQSPADIVFLSFSDSDIGAFAQGWHQGGGPEGRLPTLRLANLAALKHPLSVDTYIENTLTDARGIIIRLIGGRSYWAYGLQQVETLAKNLDIALAVLPADGRLDQQLDAVSTLPISTLRQLTVLCEKGGAMAAQAALAQMALAIGLYAGPVPGFKGVPDVGSWTPEDGVLTEVSQHKGIQQHILIVFYRSYLVAADLSPINALFSAFRSLGYNVTAIFAASLKSPQMAQWIRSSIKIIAPSAIVNATAFSGKGDDGTSPLDIGGVPVFQVALATNTRADWLKSERGLSPSDLAMHVVLPEVDGRIFAGVTSFKEPEVKDPHLEYSRFAHAAAPDRIEAVASRVDGWLKLAELPPVKRRIALVLSTYPSKNWNRGHAVGLDTLQSAKAILNDLKEAGYNVPLQSIALEHALPNIVVPWSLKKYKESLLNLPQELQKDLQDAWGAPENDSTVVDGHFQFRAVQKENVIIAFQPERGRPANREDEYHDLSQTPQHVYVAFYLWLQSNSEALVHIGAHGTLEWLPGKSVALSKTCWPDVLTGQMPVIYPFIVNDPGEAAQAKRRLGAVTLGHVPPPLARSETPDQLMRLEALLDEFSNADGLDFKRRERLQGDILTEAERLGIKQDNQSVCKTTAVQRIDRFVCDVKNSQFGEGLHIWGQTTEASAELETASSAAAEKVALLNALNGKWIAPGPSGSPYRGRLDVLPTGRNLYTIDPRAVPTRAAFSQGVRLANEFIRHHVQKEGNWPKALVLDLWGSATIRTAGEEFSMALSLLGVLPVWDDKTERVSGIEVLPISDLDRPRIDVTIRVSGLFRDVFPSLSLIFNQAIGALVERDEAPDWNPFAGQCGLNRLYGPAPGKFGLGIGAFASDYSFEARQAAGEAWINASSWALDGTHAEQDIQGITQRVAAADSFVHLQDLPETDLLLATDYAAHEAGFAAAQKVVGGNAQLYHIDNTNPAQPQTRELSTEIARVVHARAAHPEWIAGMRKHGFRGAAEIAATLDHMAAFARLADVVAPQLFDVFHDATLGDPVTNVFIADANPEAHAAMRIQFAELLRAGLWTTKSNSIRADLESAA
ncbi:MAG: cobaltochelatase subunit CobN [Aestuariivita sp.]|nr:cobaltochelatase subunit CobN [Aestuariivita sp.]